MKVWNFMFLSFFSPHRNPSLNVNNSWLSTYWPKHTAEGREYLTFEVKSSSTGKGPRIKNCVFWREYLPRLLETAGNCPFDVVNFFLRKFSRYSPLCHFISDNITKGCLNTANVPYVDGIKAVHLVTVYLIVLYSTGWFYLSPFSWIYIVEFFMPHLTYL